MKCEKVRIYSRIKDYGFRIAKKRITIGRSNTIMISDEGMSRVMNSAHEVSGRCWIETNDKGEPMDQINLSEVLTEKQMKQLVKLANKEKDVMDTSVKKKIESILESDNSKWKGVFLKGYLAYALQYSLISMKG